MIMIQNHEAAIMEVKSCMESFQNYFLF